MAGHDPSYVAILWPLSMTSFSTLLLPHRLNVKTNVGKTKKTHVTYAIKMHPQIFRLVFVTCEKIKATTHGIDSQITLDQILIYQSLAKILAVTHSLCMIIIITWSKTLCIMIKQLRPNAALHMTFVEYFIRLPALVEY